MTKPQIREMAEEQGLINARKHDSRISALYRTEIMPDLLNDTPAKALSQAIS